MKNQDYIDNLDYADLNFRVVFNDERKWKKVYYKIMLIVIKSKNFR